MSRTSVIRIFLIVTVGVALCLLVYLAPAFFSDPGSPAPARLSTGGTSVAYVIMENRWRTAYRKEKGVEVDYESTGSTNGVKRMIERKYAIAFTHTPMTEGQREKARGEGGEVVHIPVVLCAVVPVYNVKGLKDKPPLRFTGGVLADIFLGKIGKWNDPALKKLNQGVDLPDAGITVVHRADSSGTTFIFADYLHGASAAWQGQIGPARSEIKWPVGVGVRRSLGVARHVRKTEGAIGYVDLLHAFTGEIPYGAVRNQDDTAFIHAGAENMTAAATGLVADLPADLTFKLTNRRGKDAYPICGAIWAVCYQDQPASDQKKVVDFLHWVTHEGQQFATDMSYAPLPEGLVRRADQKLQLIKAAP
jgi:phosphate transport system substrate-binding protein